jgi:hypothetical protein
MHVTERCTVNGNANGPQFVVMVVTNTYLEFNVVQVHISYMKRQVGLACPCVCTTGCIFYTSCCFTFPFSNDCIHAWINSGVRNYCWHLARVVLNRILMKQKREGIKYEKARWCHGSRSWGQADAEFQETTSLVSSQFNCHIFLNHDFRLPPHWWSDLRRSGMKSVDLIFNEFRSRVVSLLQEEGISAL